MENVWTKTTQTQPSGRMSIAIDKLVQVMRIPLLTIWREKKNILEQEDDREDEKQMTAPQKNNC